MAVFSGVMDQDHGQLELALELAQVTQESGDLGGIIFIEAVKSDHRVEDEQARPQSLNRFGQALTVGGQVQTQNVGGDDFDGT